MPVNVDSFGTKTLVATLEVTYEGAAEWVSWIPSLKKFSVRNHSGFSGYRKRIVLP